MTTPKPFSLDYSYTIVGGDVPLKARICIERNKIFFDYLHIPFKVIEFTPQKTASHEADKMRLTKAATEPDILYLDWDLLILDLPHINTPENRPLFAHNPGHDRDIFYFYNGKHPDLFAEFLKTCDFDPATNKLSYWIKLKFFDGKCGKIGKNTYHHYNLGQRGVVKDEP